MADDFNRILESLKKHYPNVADGLPAAIPHHRPPLNRSGTVPINFLDLETFAEQTLNILEIAEPR